MTTASNLYDQARSEQPETIRTPLRALTIGAHPDDAEFGAGGTLARWSDEGCAVTMLILTDGSKGTWDPSIPAEELITTRQAEQRQSANVLGAADVVMLGHPDGGLTQSPRLVRELCWWIRTVRPDVIFGHDPWKRWMLHPDHRAAGMTMIDAIVAARDHLYHPEMGLEKHRPDWILLWSADENDHFEDIETTFDRKIEALLRHASQGTTTMGGAESGDLERQRFVDRMRDWAAEQGEPVGLAFAEAFKRLQP